MTTKGEIFKHWERKNDEPNRRHLGASQIGNECLRSVWYNFYWVMKVVFKGRILRLFDRGFEFEDRVTDELRAIGYTVSTVDDDGNQYRLGEVGLLSGSCDGYIYIDGEWMIMECKTHNDKSFKKLEKDRVEKSKPQHLAQMHVYMGYAGLKKALYVAENKNDSDLYFEVIEYDESAFATHRGNALRIRKGGPPSKISDNKTFFLCKWCDFSDVCHNDAVPDVNCRTCVNFSLGSSNEPICSRYGTASVISEDLEQTGCEDHVYRPDLCSFEVSEGSTDWVVYTNGVANCSRTGFPAVNNRTDIKAVYTSHELRACLQWKKVESTISIKQTFGGEVEL